MAVDYCLVDYCLRVPSELERYRFLERKLEEYEDRIEKTGDVYTHLEIKALLNPDAVHKSIILSRLLGRGEVSSLKLSRELQELLREAFDPEAFNVAFAVIRDYVETGGQNVMKARDL